MEKSELMDHYPCCFMNALMLVSSQYANKANRYQLQIFVTLLKIDMKYTEAGGKGHKLLSTSSFVPLLTDLLPKHHPWPDTRGGQHAC
jgi:hypothetical protein